MTIGIAAAVRTSMMTDIRDAIDAGAGAGRLQIYSGTRPATGAAPGAAVLLADIPLNDPCGTVASGVLTFGGMPREATAAAGGTAAWARFVDSTGAFVADASVTVSGGGGIVQLASLTIANGQTVRVTSGQLTEGNP